MRDTLTAGSGIRGPVPVNSEQDRCPVLNIPLIPISSSRPAGRATLFLLTLILASVFLVVPSPIHAAGKPDDLSAAVRDFVRRNKVDGRSGWEEYLDPARRGELREMEAAMPRGLAGPCWSYFFTFTLTGVGPGHGNAAMVGFYHPWSDTWLLSRWQSRPHPRIEALALVPGDRLRNLAGPVDWRPLWQRDRGQGAQPVTRAVLTSLDRFNQLLKSGQSRQEVVGSMRGLERYEQPVVAVLLAAWMRSCSLLQARPDTPMAARLAGEGRALIRVGRTGRIKPLLRSATATGAATRDRLAQWSPARYGSLVPVDWTGDDRQATLFLSREDNSDLCLALHFRVSPDTLRLDRVELMDFRELWRRHQRREVTP